MKPRLSLRWLLLGIGVIGTTVGLGVRWSLEARYTYITRGIYVSASRCRICAAWREDGLGQQQLQYLLVLPIGDKTVTGGSDSTTTVFRKQAIASEGLDLHQTEFYLNGQRVPGFEGGRVWLYRPPEDDVVIVNVGATKPPISVQQFEAFAESEIWRNDIKPLVDAQARKWLETHLK